MRTARARMAAARLPRRSAALARSVPSARSASAIDGALLMPQQQRVDQRIAELADAHLQRAAVAHQRAHVHADGVIHRADRQIRRAEQVVVVALVIDEPVEALRRRCRMARS